MLQIKLIITTKRTTSTHLHLLPLLQLIKNNLLPRHVADEHPVALVVLVQQDVRLRPVLLRRLVVIVVFSACGDPPLAI